MANKKILIIDDEPEMVELMKIRLEANKFDVITASEGSEGLEKLRKEKPDLVLLDIMMPNMDGYLFAREVKKDPAIAGVPIIVVTAKPGMKYLFEAEGIKDYMVKPFESKELLDKINKYLKV